MVVLLTLPNEMLENIISQVDNRKDLSSLSKTCRRLHHMGMIRLYERFTDTYKKSARDYGQGDERYNHPKLGSWLYHAARYDLPHIIHFAARKDMQHLRSWVMNTFTLDYTLNMALTLGALRVANVLFEMGADIIWKGDNNQMDTRDDELRVLIRAERPTEYHHTHNRFQPSMDTVIRLHYAGANLHRYDSEKLFWQEKEKILLLTFEKLRHHHTLNGVADQSPESGLTRYRLALSKGLDRATRVEDGHCIDMMECFIAAGARIDWENDPSRSKRGSSPLSSILRTTTPNIFKAKMNLLLRHGVAITFQTLIDQGSSETLGSAAARQLEDEIIHIPEGICGPEVPSISDTGLEYWKALYLDNVFATTAATAQSNIPRPYADGTSNSQPVPEDEGNSIITELLTREGDLRTLHDWMGGGPDTGPGRPSWLDDYSLTYCVPRENDDEDRMARGIWGGSAALEELDTRTSNWLLAAEAEARFCQYHDIRTELKRLKRKVVSQWKSYYINFVKEMREQVEAYERRDKDAYKPEFGERGEWDFLRSNDRDRAFKRILDLFGYEFSKEEISDLDYDGFRAYYRW